MRSFRLLALLPLTLVACSAPAPPASPRPPCGQAPLAASHRFNLSPFETGLPTQGQWRDGFVLADINADGRPDVVHGPPRKGPMQPVIFLGDAQGRFQPWSGTHFPPLPYDYGDVAVADVNGDGAMDMALAAHLRGLTVLIQEGKGQFAPWNSGLRLEAPNPAAAPLFTSRRLELLDWNGDRRPDLLALNEGPSRLAQTARQGEAVALYLNRQGFWEAAPVLQSLNLFGSSLSTGDIDGDGHVDALIGTQNPGARLIVLLGHENSWLPRELKSLPPKALVTAVALRNVRADRRPEVIEATRYVEGDHWCNALDVVEWSPSKELLSVLWSDRADEPIVAVAAEDFDHDGYVDITAVRERGSVLLFAGGRNGFTADVSIPAPAWLEGCSAHDMQLADLNGDGTYEMIISFAGEPSVAGGTCRSRGGFVAWQVRPGGSPTPQSDSHG